MSTLQSDEGDASERELLVDEIQRIRQTLRGTADAVNKLSSEDEEDDEEYEEEEEEENKRPCTDNASLKNPISIKSPLQTVNYLSNPKQGSVLTRKGEVLREDNCEGQEQLSERTPSASNCVNNQGFLRGLPCQAQIDTDLLPSQNHNVSSDEFILTELQPVRFQPSVCHPDVSQEGHVANSWPVELNQHHCQNDIYQLQKEQGPPYNDDVDDEFDCDYGMSSEIHQCLSLNRDYQLVILDELERIEHALIRNRQKQMGLHQMRMNKDDTKPEPHTLIKFANPYFKDSSSLGPPDNDDTKIKRQSSQVGGYQIPSKCWNLKEKSSLAEGVRMQNLENKLSPVLQKIKLLEGTKEKTKRELKELEDLKAESLRIRNLGNETLERDLEAIDWDKLSSKYLPKRSGFECRLQWCNFGHPDVNRAPWTKEEDKKLIQLAKDPPNTWDIIAQKLQTKRTPIHCYERYQRSLNKNLLKSKWTPEDDQQLLEVVRVVGHGNWPRVASFLEGRHGDQCLHRYTQTLQMVRKGKWEEFEDELLKKAIGKYGPCNWNKLSEMVPGRSGPQCRERWVNAMDPKIDKGPWTEEQDRNLLENVEKFGKGNWSKIARAMGNRTDNQCWRRWIVICKDDSLHYRQNTLRKKRELVANFTGRRQERPELRPEDLDIPDVPVVRKRKGRAPRPIEEARAMRRATQRKFREKKRAERREEERISAEEERAEKDNKIALKATNNGDSDQRELERVRVPEYQEGQQEANAGIGEDKFPRTRKAGGNRNRVQQPHHRVLMDNKQLFKRKQVADKKEQRHTRSSSGEKQVTVSGSLGPFSLLLQAFSIDIATVLRAIQQTSTTPSSVSSTVTTVGANTGASVKSDEVNSTKEQAEGQTCGGIERMEAQRKTVGSEILNPKSCESDMHNSTLDKQTSTEANNHKEAENSTETESRVNKEKQCGTTDTLEPKNTDMESSIRKEIPDTRPNNKAPESSENAHSGSYRVEAVNKPPAASSAVLASQTTRRRAPAIPPLPPCYTTLETYKSLQLLRPRLQKIAAMLNIVPVVSSTVSSTSGQSSLLSKSDSHVNKETGVTSDSRNGVVGANQPNRCNSANKTHDNVGSLGGEIANNHDVSLENPSDKEGSNVSQLNEESSEFVGHGAEPLEGTETAAVQSRFIHSGRKESLSSENPSLLQIGVVPSTATANEEGNRSSTTGVETNRPVESNWQQAAPVIPLNNTSYRNSFEYRMLSSRFSSLFCWPALLSRIPVNRFSQIGPVFAERHPPPRGGVQSTKPKTVTNRRKQRGLAAVRMASSASFSTPGQQMCSLGQGFAIRKNVPPSQPSKESSGSKEVVVAASQLLSLQESTRSFSLSSANKRPCSTRQNKRKITPVKRYTNQECEAKKKKIVLSSDSHSSPSEDDDDDDEDESDYVPGKEIRNVREFRSAPNTRRSSLRNMVSQTLKDSQTISGVQAGASSCTTEGAANNANEIVSNDHENSIDHNTNESGPSFQGINESVPQGEEILKQDASDVIRLQDNNTSISSSKGNTKPKKTGGACWRAMLPRVDDSEGTDVDTQ